MHHLTAWTDQSLLGSVDDRLCDLRLSTPPSGADRRRSTADSFPLWAAGREDNTVDPSPHMGQDCLPWMRTVVRASATEPTWRRTRPSGWTTPSSRVSLPHAFL